jgi:hypothetical protein
MKRKEQIILPDTAIDGYVKSAEAFYPTFITNIFNSDSSSINYGTNILF